MNYQSTQETQPLIRGLDVSEQPSLSQVRRAYENRDILQSIRIHNERTSIAAESHDQAAAQSHFVGQISATIQGVLMTMAIVQTALAANAGYGLMWTFVLANMLSAGFGFSSNEVLQTISHRLFVEGEARREVWEIEVNVEGEVNEMVDLFVQKGVDENTARTIWTNFAKVPQVFLEAMMAAEIGVIYPLPHLDPKQLMLNRAVAFVIGAMLPMGNFIVALLVSKWVHMDSTFHAIVSLAVSLTSLFYLGSQRNRGYPVTSESDSVKLNNGLQSLLCGAVCAGLAFLVGNVYSSFSIFH